MARTDPLIVPLAQVPMVVFGLAAPMKVTTSSKFTFLPYAASSALPPSKPPVVAATAAHTPSAPSPNASRAALLAPLQSRPGFCLQHRVPAKEPEREVTGYDRCPVGDQPIAEHSGDGRGGGDPDVSEAGDEGRFKRSESAGCR